MDALLAKVAPEDSNSPNSRACAMIEHGSIRARRMEPALHRVHNLVINIAGGTLRRTDAGMVGTLYTVAPDRSIQAFLRRDPARLCASNNRQALFLG